MFIERRNGIPEATYSVAIEPTNPTVISSARSPSITFRHSLPIAYLLQDAVDGLVQLLRLLHLRLQQRRQPGQLLLERLVVAGVVGRADVAARRQGVPVVADGVE